MTRPKEKQGKGREEERESHKRNNRNLRIRETDWGLKMEEVGRGHLNGAADPLVVDGEKFRERMRRWCDEFDRLNASGEYGDVEERSMTDYYPISATEYLAERVGVEQDTVRKTLNGSLAGKWISLGKVDSFLTAAGLSSLLDGELAPVPNPRWSKERWEAWRTWEAGQCAD